MVICPFNTLFTQKHTDERAVSLNSEQPSYSLTRKVSSFIRDNWRILVAYAIAWALIIVVMGAMHGFSKVSVPITIGLSAGIIFGALTAIVIVGMIHKYNKSHKEDEKITPYSGWQLFRKCVLSQLDQMISTLFVSVMVTLICLVMLRLPHGTSSIIGAIMGNHLFTQILLRKPREHTIKDEKAENIQLSPKEQSEQIILLTQKVATLERQLQLKNNRQYATSRQRRSSIAI
jgi:hypothetical protein